MRFPWSRVKKDQVNHLFPELRHQAEQLNLSVCDAVEDRGIIKIALYNQKVVFLFIYEERDQDLLPLYLNPDEYELYKSSVFRDHLGGSITFVLQERMAQPGNRVPSFNIRDQAETRAVISQLFEDIREFAPDLLEGKGFEEGRPKVVPPVPRMIRKFDQTD